ncbi:MAG TPA: recombination protein O N-terminal domain-containing protein [Saprospiraceae bacterium]|nr:recombination protein O N-terminal domain-containing protein [Saprospiraceae bacterium]HNT22124.1 recombination protein O N-terminal domain-containing protein [Saprospiraceae bacterium]
MSALIQTEGIVVRTIKYGETSVITEVLTRKLGSQSFIMGGVTAGNARSGLFQIMNQLEVVVYYKENRTLHRIKEARFLKTYQALSFEIHRSAIGIFILEMVRKCLRGSVQDEALYQWVKDCLDLADQRTTPLPWLPVYFALGFTRFLGIQPLKCADPDHRVFDLREGLFLNRAPHHPDYLEGAATALLSRVLECEDILELAEINSTTRSTRKALLASILDYYRMHLDHFQGLESPQILEEILTA